MIIYFSLCGCNNFNTLYCVSATFNLAVVIIPINYWARDLVKINSRCETEMDDKRNVVER